MHFRNNNTENFNTNAALLSSAVPFDQGHFLQALFVQKVCVRPVRKCDLNEIFVHLLNLGNVALATVPQLSQE